MKRLAFLMLLPGAALGQDMPAPDCSSLESFLATHGIAYEVAVSHALYPQAAQSQTCPVEARLTSEEYRAALLGMVRAFGCEPGSGAYAQSETMVADGVPDGMIEETGVDGIPERYLSEDPAFCDAKPLADLIACADPGAACEPFLDPEEDS